MEGTDGREILLSAFTEKEWRRVPSEIAKKLETYIGTKFNELIRHKALMEAKNSSAVQNLTDIHGKHDELKQEHDKIVKKLSHANNTISELENQLGNSVTDVSKLQLNCNKLESDLNDVKNQRNAIMAEKEEVCRMMERRKLELERMECEMNALTKQLEEAVSAKCEALNKINEANSMKIAIEYKEQHLEREKSLLKNQIMSLTKDLDERTDELLSMKRDSSCRYVQVEIKLSEKTQELENANEAIKHLTENNNSLMAKTEELIQKLGQEKENYLKTLEAYQNEVDSQKKIAELYKNVSEQQTTHANELSTAAQELKEKLDEALERYGDLETKYKEAVLAHEEVMAKKTEYIDMLKKELTTANDLISNRPEISTEDEELLPKIKSGMSITEIYSRYVQVTECMAQEKAENKRLQSYIQSIIQEVEEKGPLIAKQRELYEKAVDTIEEMTKQIDAYTMENQQLRELKMDLKRSSLSTDRENERLKREVTDLSRQVCHLLREVEMKSRTGSSVNSMDHDHSDSTCSADIISKRLVTFSDISELQSTNARLLALVRELSSKQEEAETMDPEMIMAMKQKLDQMREQQAAFLEEQDNHNSMVKSLVEQRDTYKSLYHQFIKGQPDIDGDKSSTSKNNEDSDLQTDEKHQEYEQMLEKKTKEIAMIKEELDTYKMEKAAHEKIILEQSEKLRSELQEMMRQNNKLSTKCETTDDMIKIAKNNTDVYKNQIERLEERIRIYNDTIIKHEATQEYLKQQIMETQSKLSKVESQFASLQKENMLLRDSESRLKYEREHLIREQQSNSTMLANIELIKATLERNDAESKMRLEDILKDAHRECASLRLRLQQEQDRFRELGDNLKKIADSAEKRMEEEKTLADSLRTDLNLARENIALKSQQLEELAKKLKNPILDELEVSVERRKIRELEQNVFDSKAVVESLTEKLKISKEAVEQHRNVAQAAEIQLKDLKAQFNMDKVAFEKQIGELQKKIELLEEHNAELQGELSLQSDGQVNATSTLHGKLNKLEIQNKVLNDELLSSKTLLDETKEQIKQLQDNINVAENKYIQEMKARSEELQVLHAFKEERMKMLDELNAIKSERDQLKETFEESKCSWNNQEDLYKKAKEELETKTEDLNMQNSLLLNQLEAINEQMSLLHTKISDPNRSIGADTSLNKSFIEDENKSSDQLVKIIKYLRREKDLAINKCEILEAEHNRIIAEQDILKRQCEDAKKALDSQQQDTEVSVITAARHAEVLRKVETLNALTDSNRSLRSERDLLITELNELKQRTSTLEDQITPLQEKNTELQKKAESMQTENITLRGEATRWRQRANILIEKSNRTSPEDWKKLQQERETLVKQLTVERGNTAKLTEENNNLRSENTKLDEQIRTLTSQLEQQRNEAIKLNEELVSLRTQVTSLNQEVDQARVQIININEDNRKLNENITSKDVAINDVKNNLSQIRKIAKKYKIQAEEQQKELESLKQQIQQKENMSTVSDEKRDELLQQTRLQLEQQISQLNQSHNERINELNDQVNSSQEEYEKSQKEIVTLNEKLSSSLEKEERFKVLFKNAKDRIVSLTEQNSSLKSQIDNRDSNGDGQQGGSNNDDLQRCQKEKDDLLNEMQQDKERYIREIEALTQRVNQLQRQLGQQGSKPSTSTEKEKSTTEPPTANIKPMAGHSTNTQTQSVPIQPWRSGGEPPLASIRPMSQQRTAAVLPTSQSPSTVMVPPQQQVHTTGNSGIEAMSSSPTSSHTDYVPATSSASLLGPRQVAVPPTQSNQDNEDDDSNMQVQQVQQQQVVAMVLPRVEPPSPAQEQGTSSSSSNTVTTTQAGHKRPRERESGSDGGEDSKTNQQPKRTRIVQGTSSSGAEGSVSESGLEVEYQVPTSSQRDHEEDAVIVVESDEEGPDEGEGDDYNMPYEDADQDDEGGNEVEVIEDSSEVPNQSERGENDLQADGDEEEDCDAAEEREEEEEAMQPEATSSGTSISTSVAVTLPSFQRTRVAPLSRNQQTNLGQSQMLGETGEEDKSLQPEATSSGTNVSTSVAVTLPSFSRTRVAPLSRTQQGNLILPPMDEGGDDGIVPSTPTLASSRRCDGFGDAVSSPHVPSGRFTFMESSAPNTATNDVLPEQTLEMSSHTDDNSTGRSVPNTPLQTSPHESGPSCEEQATHHLAEGGAIPEITISGAEDVESAEGGDCMGPPSIAGTSAEVSQLHAEQTEEMQEGEDGVSSEGEKTANTEEGEEEGREAEASPSTNTRSRNIRGTPVPTARRGIRGTHVRGVARHTPQPIVWADPQSEMHQRPGNLGSMHRGGRGGPNIMPFSPRGPRRPRARRSSFGGRY